MTKPTAASNPLLPGSPCPCGSGQTFAACCEPFLLGQATAPTAEALMRSRFTAHVVGNFAHLHRTYLATAKLPFQAEEESEELDWTRLVVHAHEDGPRPDLAFVDFSAYFQHESGERVLHEKAEFKRIEGAWYYTRAVRIGPAPVRSSHPKVGRNDPCPCGSGKKYKQCCLRVA